MIATVCIPTYNAAEHLDATLRSVAGAAHILVHDCGSTDDTVKIARAHGAHVRVFWGQTWDVFPEYTFRNRLTSAAAEVFPDTTHILLMDADEVVSHNWPAVLDNWAAAYPQYGFGVQYYQLVGHPAFMQGTGPIEYRLLCAPVGAGPFFADSGRVGPHQCAADMSRTILLRDIHWFHLGYTGNLTARWRRNIARGDYATAEPGHNDWLMRKLYPWNDVRPVPQALRDTCLTLNTLIAKDKREVFLGEGGTTIAYIGCNEP